MTSALRSGSSRAGRGFGSARLTRWATLLAIGVLVTALAVGLPRGVSKLSGYDNWLRDGLISLFGPKFEPRTDMAVLAINEATLDTLPYRSPIDRGFLAEVLTFLQQAKVRGVIVDILFVKA